MEAMLLAAGASAGTAATVSTAFTVASTAFSAVSALSQASGARANYQNQARVSEYNATVGRNEATRALQESSAAQMAHRRRAAELLGAQRAAIAQSGTGFGGSNADLYDESVSLAELDALNLAYEGETRSRARNAGASLDDWYGGVARSNASGARTAGIFNAGRTLIGGVENYANRPRSPRSPLTGGGGYNGSALNIYGAPRYG